MPLKHQFENEMDFYEALRDWFATQAMNALVGNSSNRGTASEAVKIAYGIADAMLLEKLKK